MSKYVIDTTLDNVKKVIAMGVTKGGAIWTDTTDIENLEELNSDYINEHYGELQDEAYQKGINDGSLDVKQRVEGAYQAGLNDVWEVVKKIFGYEIDGALSIDEIGEAFGYKKEDVFYTADIIRANTAEQAIAKLKAYEEKQKQDDKIEVGDEVKSLSDSGVEIEGLLPWVVTTVDQGDYCQGIDSKGEVHATKKVRACKTGRHFDIEKILEAMKHD